MELTLVTTRDCNLRCPYCYAGEKVCADMTWDTARRGMDLAFARQDGAVPGLHFFGGEPLMNWDLMVRADAYFTEHWGGGVVKKSVTTNGTLLTKERARWLSAHGYYIGVSLDGGKKSHDHYRSFAGGQGSFDTVFRNARFLIEQDIRFKTIVVVDPAHLNRLYDDVVYLYENGFRAVSLNLNTGAVWNWFSMHKLKKALKRLSRYYILEKFLGHSFHINVFDGKLAVLKTGGYTSLDHCQMGMRELTLAPSGYFYPCERFVGDDDDSAVRIGHIDTGIDRDRVLSFQHPRQMPECSQCRYSPFCVNWCGCNNYTMTGVWDEVSGVLCRYEQLLVDVARDMAAV